MDIVLSPCPYCYEIQLMKYSDTFPSIMCTVCGLKRDVYGMMFYWKDDKLYIPMSGFTETMYAYMKSAKVIIR